MNLRHLLQLFTHSQFNTLMQLRPFEVAVSAGNYEEALQVAGELLS
jgi:hypothetical protein